MSDNMKYYYIKLKDNYFEQDNIKVLESMPNGHIYSLILIKLYLKASKYGGQLKMTPTIPYDPESVQTLASVINHDVSHVKEALKIAVDLDLIRIIDGREIWLTEIQNLIGSSSTEADRIREYRRTLGPGSSSNGKEIIATPEKKEPTKKEEVQETETQKQAKELARYLKDLHKKVDPKYKGNVKGWMPYIERILRIDGRSYDEVRSVIEWAKTPDSFWFPNIMSGKKLREKFDTLIMQMRRDLPKAEGKKNLEDIARKYNIKE
jgi:predicted phage replisome organizer